MFHNNMQPSTRRRPDRPGTATFAAVITICAIAVAWTEAAPVAQEPQTVFTEFDGLPGAAVSDDGRTLEIRVRASWQDHTVPRLLCARFDEQPQAVKEFRAAARAVREGLPETVGGSLLRTFLDHRPTTDVRITRLGERRYRARQEPRPSTLRVRCSLPD
ncbi:MAG: hypothetical protein F4Z93_02035 [Rhodospirillales bacterium]|nr:hypothetical protein [Rhodospirillales bacterium]